MLLRACHGPMAGWIGCHAQFHAKEIARKALPVAQSASLLARGMINVAEVAKTTKQTQPLAHTEALKVLRAYVLPATWRGPETLEIKVMVTRFAKKQKQLLAVKGLALLPHDAAKKRRVCVLSEDEEERELAMAQGALMAGGLELLQELVEDTADRENIDVIVANKELTSSVNKVARILKALTPTRAQGTLTDDVANMTRLMTNSVPFRFDITPAVCAAVGKMSLSDEQLFENIKAFVEAVEKAMPSGYTDGPFIKKVYVSTTFGTGVPLLLDELLPAKKEEEANVDA